MRVAFIGDIVGTGGREAVIRAVPVLRGEHGADLILANAENIADGSGIKPLDYTRLREGGVDGITLGDHAFRKGQINRILGSQGDMIRPLNLPEAARGRGWMRIPCGSAGAAVSELWVVTVLGRLFITQLPAGGPFDALDRLLVKVPRNAAVIVEVHAEATSEKQAIAWHLNGRVAAVVGSHTHVQTSDNRLLPRDFAGAPDIDAARLQGPSDQGTAYLGDLGMSGPHDSVLGRRVDAVLSHMAAAIPAPFDVAQDNLRVQGALIDIDPATRLATGIERFDLPMDESI